MNCFNQFELDVISISERLSPSQSASKYHKLPPTSDIKGLWSAEYMPFMTGILDAFADTNIREIYFKKSTQTGGTEAIIICVLWAMQFYPGDILYISADAHLAEYTNKKRFRPVLESDNQLKTMVESWTDSEIRFKHGYSIYFYTAQSMGAALGRPFRYVILDEVDSWEGVKNIGNMIQTFRERMSTFDHAKMFALYKPRFENSHINNL